MEDIRISASSLIKIPIDGKFVVSLNKGQLKVGQKTYTPMGGALTYKEDSRPFLDSIGCREFEGKQHDLRFIMPKDSLPTFRNWFNRRIDRETTPDREFYEESIDEENIFHEKPKIRSEYLFTTEEVGFSKRRPSVITDRFFEIYGIAFTDQNDYQMIKDACSKPDSHLYAISESEILGGITKDGIEVGSNCLPLINGYKPKIIRL